MADVPARLRWTQRLQVRVYAALLASLATFGLLFWLWHEFPGSHAGPPRFAAILSGLMLTVALGAYPVVRRLTRRLEHLQASVEALGAGQLSTRVAVEGRDEVARLATSFNASAARIEALVTAQKRLLANASHELRSPLARIRLAIEFLQERAPVDVRDELVRNLGELDHLVDEILLSSRLDAAATTAIAGEPIDLTGLVAEECALDDVPLAATAVGVHGDVRLLRRLVRNLLENARKHGAADVRAEVTGEGGHAVLRVRDRGPGLPVEERERIFEPFYRPANSRETGSGWGLGLALVRQIATHHGGRVQCLENPGGGCVFEVVLPCGGSRYSGDASGSDRGKASPL